MTYTIVARCRRTEMFGVAVVSSSPAVAARCAFAEQGVGAVATQNLTDPRLGTRALDLMRGGAGAIEAISILKGTHPHMAWRQLLAVDREGRTAAYSGEHVQPLSGEARALDVACAGNLLSDRSVPAAMVAAFQASTRPRRRSHPQGPPGRSRRRRRTGTDAVGGAEARAGVGELAGR